MYEEPYRWVEAVGNRRHYLDEQFTQGSPVVGVSFGDGLLLLTLSRGTPKLYEIYDRIGVGGMGHPADLEKLRFSLLEMAHLEGFNRSPSDVTASRLMKYGLASTIKQAFEEVFKAPFIVKMLLAELGLKAGQERFLTIDYDGTFDESSVCGVLAATPQAQDAMRRYLTDRAVAGSATLGQAVEAAVNVWAAGSLAQQAEPSRDERAHGQDESPSPSAPDVARVPDDAALHAHLREALAERTVECAVLERSMSGSSKYRPVKQDELNRLLPDSLRTTA